MASSKKRIAVVMGTRPNFVKAAPFFRRSREYGDIKFTPIHTGQHFDENMSQVFFDQMEIPKPDVFLGVKGSLYSEKIGRMFSGLDEIFKKEKFDGCVLFGDVNSTLAGGIAATKNHYPIFHVEAGLRSHDRRMPEETNRVIVDHLSSLLFTTEPSANENLAREGISESKIRYVGNIMIESLEVFSDHIDESKILETLSLNKREYVVTTVHRQENTAHIPTFEKILSTLAEVSKKHTLVLPLHPGTKEKIEKHNLSDYLDRVQVVAPLGYFEFVKLIKEAKGVVTDSGGIQEETTHLGVPCCTIRDNTERPITLDVGTNKLFPIAELSSKDLLCHINRDDFKAKNILLWDNKVSKRILDTFMEAL